MINRSIFARSLSAAFGLAAVLAAGHFSGADAQVVRDGRDPFAKPGWAKTRETRPGAPGGIKRSPAQPGGLNAPAIEQRIEFYKRLRETAAANGQPIPKVTSVLTLSEMAVTGIFRTPRGYAAMVEATPIKLSYTIYPGEKFFDGQLVAVEENRLVFRKVTKMSDGKFVSSVENKPLRQYTTQEVVQGTAPADGRPPETVAAYQPPQPETPKAAGPIVSPLDEMDTRPAQKAEQKAPAKKTPARRPAKVASNK
jgi:hypothetical protein